MDEQSTINLLTTIKNQDKQITKLKSKVIKEKKRHKKTLTELIDLMGEHVDKNAKQTSVIDEPNIDAPFNYDEPIKRNDDITQYILNWNNNTRNNNITINQVLYNWECDFLGDDNNKCEWEAVHELYNKLNDEFNNDKKKRGRDFLEAFQNNDVMIVGVFVKLSSIVDAIEDLYNHTEYLCGKYMNKRRLEDKLDLIFYKHAEKEFVNELKKHRLEMDYWEANRY
jgi:predicted RNA-binding protein